MRRQWESCTHLLTIPGRGQVRCWKPPAYADFAGQGLCEEHARLLVEQHGLDRLREQDRQRFLERNPEWRP